MRHHAVTVSVFHSAVVLSMTLMSHAASAACSYADAAIYNGWGWDAVAGVSCPPQDACDYTDADSYGGWGWNPGTQTSCPPLMPTAGACVDEDGDGWGWDGIRSCLIDEPTPATDRLIFADVPGSATAYEYSLTPDGATSVFQYWGDDLYSGDNGGADLFVMDNNSGTVKLLSVGENGAKANNDSYLRGVTGDGRTALIVSRVTNFANTTANGVQQPYLVDVATGTITQVLDSSPWSYVNAVLSADGKYVAFGTPAANIVAGDRNDASDVFLYEVDSGSITRVSLTAAGDELAGDARIRDISADGRYVLFLYESDGRSTGTQWLTGIYVYDRIENTNTAVRYVSDGYYAASISDDGSVIAYQYRHSDGTALAWLNRETGDVGAIDTTGEGYSSAPDLSPDGKYVVYSSSKTGLDDDVDVSGQRHQAYLAELPAGKTRLISRSVDGSEANGFVGSPEFVAGGKYVRFVSNASNLHSQDTDTNTDVFLYRMPDE